MGLKLNKAAKSKSTLKLEIENDDNSTTEYRWKIDRIANSDLLRLAARSESAMAEKLVSLIDSSEPLGDTPPLSEVLDMTDEAGLNQVTEAIIKAAGSSSLDDLADGAGSEEA